MPRPAFEDLLDASDRPCWLLDVDGVLNAARPRWPGGAEHGTVHSTAAGPLRLTWSPRLLDRVRALATSDRIDVVWATTWCPDAALLERLWDLPALARAWTAELHGPAAADAKHAAALEVALAVRPLVWTDDEHADDLARPDRLEIRPRLEHGLTPRDLDAVEAFVGQCGG